MLKCINPIIIRNRKKFDNNLAIFDYQKLLDKNPTYRVLSSFIWHDRPSEKLQVPCGKCPACKARKKLEWKLRLDEEAKTSPIIRFVTFTYNQENLPKDKQLQKEDVQKFFKRLRRQFEYHFGAKDMLKYIVVGEYGDKFGRPHYHGILFFKKNLKINVDKIINENWQKGFISSQSPRSTKGTVKYCLKYMQKGNSKFDHLRQMRPLRSNGLGRSYIDKTVDYYLADIENRNYYLTPEGKKYPMPSYYTYLLKKKGVIPDPPKNSNIYDLYMFKKFEKILENEKNEIILRTGSFDFDKASYYYNYYKHQRDVSALNELMRFENKRVQVMKPMYKQNFVEIPML